MERRVSFLEAMGLPSGRSNDAPENTAPSPAFVPAERRGKRGDAHQSVAGDDTSARLLLLDVYEERGSVELTPKDRCGADTELDMLTELVSTGNTPWFVFAHGAAPHLDLGGRCTSRVDLYKQHMQAKAWPSTRPGAQQCREQESPAAGRAAPDAAGVQASVPPSPVPQRLIEQLAAWQASSSNDQATLPELRACLQSSSSPSSGASRQGRSETASDWAAQLLSSARSR
jgi:hypothetical protein